MRSSARALARPMPISSFGCSSPIAHLRISACALITRTAACSCARPASSARSHLVMKMRSASAIWRSASGEVSNCCSALTASTSVTTPSSRYCAPSMPSLARVWITGAGSARPVVSMKTRSKSGITPARRSPKSSRSVSCKSVRTLQHRQPLASRLTFSDDILTRSLSMPISPISLMTTATRSMSGWRSKRLISVVLPAPRKPVISVTGILPASGSRSDIHL